MEKAMHRTLQLFFLVSAAWAVSVAGGQAAGLQLALQTTAGDTYAPYEPIVLKYWVENSSETAASIPALIDPEYGWITFEIASDEGPFKPYRTGELADVGWRTASLEPGERLASEVVIVTNLYGRAARMNRQFAGTKLFPFSDAGRYRIRATYPLAREGDPPLTSNTIEFMVRAASESEAEAFGFFHEPEEFAAAVGADGEVKDPSAALRRWEEFVERYPDSVYTPAVRMNLGRLYLHGIGMDRPDPGMAARHFRAAVDAGAGGRVDDALLDLAKSEIERGSVVEAEAMLTDFLARFPDSERKAEAIRLRDGLAKGFRTLRDIYSN